MSNPLPESVRIFGIEAHGERGIYSCHDEDRRMTVEVNPSTARTLFWAAVSLDGCVIEGPSERDPQSAVDALHALVKRLAGEIR